MARHERTTTAALALGAAGGLATLAWLIARRGRRSLAGKLCLVTGGSRGHGLLLARELGDAGARVVICARDGHELQRAARWLADEGVEADTHVCDVRSRDAVDAMIGAVEGTHGPVDVLVNNAGLLYFGPATAMTHEDLRTAMDTNFWGAVHCTEAVLPSMLARKDGHIVNICSVGGVSPVPFMLPYSASKAALNGYSLGLNYDLAREGIAVTAVHPFVMRTGGAVNGHYRGDERRGLYAGIALADSNALFSVSARRVARKVVRAIRRRDTVVFVGWRTRIVAALQGVMPRALAVVYRMVARALPDSSSRGGETGVEMVHELDGRWRRVAERARAKNNQPAPT